MRTGTKIAMLVVAVFVTAAVLLGMYGDMDDGTTPVLIIAASVISAAAIAYLAGYGPKRRPDTTFDDLKHGAYAKP